MFPAPVH